MFLWAPVLLTDDAVHQKGDAHPWLTEWSSSTPSEVNDKAQLYFQISSWNVVALQPPAVKSHQRGPGRALRAGSWTLPSMQHIPNFGKHFELAASFSVSQWRAPQWGHRMSMQPKSCHWGGPWYRWRPARNSCHDLPHCNVVCVAVLWTWFARWAGVKPLDYINDLLLLTYILPNLAAQWFVNICHGLVDCLEEALYINKIRWNNDV